MKTTTISYIMRNADTKEPIQRFSRESDAVNMAGKFNKRYNREAAEVVKIVNTIEMVEIPTISKQEFFDELEELGKYLDNSFTGWKMA